MDNLYIPRKRRFYNRSVDKCLTELVYIDPETGDRQTRDSTFCASPYCNLHGLVNRQILSYKIEQRLGQLSFHHGMTIHGGGILNYKQLSVLYTKFKAEMFQRWPRSDAVKINHWLVNRSDTTWKDPHFHIMLSDDMIRTRTEFKQLLAIARIKAKIDPAIRIRLGFKVHPLDKNYEPKVVKWCVYCCQIGRFASRLVLPPYGTRWEMCRLGKVRKGKLK